MKWINVVDMKAGKYRKPPKGRPLICYCPEWNELGYQTSHWDGSEFIYNENEEFDKYVVKYALFMEAD